MRKLSNYLNVFGTIYNFQQQVAQQVSKQEQRIYKSVNLYQKPVEKALFFS
ncbi:hypothetical protein [Flammeovirga kamogawensis]|uniref:Uncharacterized protein n=1 Tax=Flammeovirga kamogawensis TaxID=373891 RepID=A0ABX8GWB6_9BACT|nr:hypothetical protein [Flammeovirga kamogawensis]MBB6461133.1 hypothetical protein [Flammeovirga kamogawensis]QWG07699.1 hypothetical protein KM029_01815 [Flammeovirga kamogawensis]